MTILSKKKQNITKDRRGENSSNSEVDVLGVQAEHNAAGSINLPNSSYQVRGSNAYTVDLHGVQNDHNSGSIVLTASGSYEGSVDRREDFDENGGPSHGKRHRRRASPHGGCINRSSRSKRERERERARGTTGNNVGSGNEREREREHERQSTPPIASSSSGSLGGGDGSVMPNSRMAIAASAAEHEQANGYNSGDEYTGRTGNDLTFTEWQERDRWFENRLRKMGFIVKEMGEDGACLFRAVADQVYGDQEMHGVVRKHCMDYIAANQEFFSHFVAEDFTTYVDRKRQEYVHGNHIEMQAMSEMYNRSVELFCYSTEPINIFHGVHKSDNEPIRLSYQRGSHYNSIVDPYKATIGVGLGLPSFNPGSADQELISNAVRQSEELHIEQTMLEDKIKATDWEATNEAIEEQVARESYLQWLRDNEMRKADCLYLFAQIVLGVHHIHSKSILHRDLKPDNIMLTGHMGDIVKIGDFGLSRDLRISNMSHAGSYYYIAPEMLKKESYNLKSDIWSMGVILHEMLTKELAFPASSMREIIKMISNEKPHLFQTSDVSVETQVIVYKMLQQNSTKRPSTRLLLLCPSLVPYIAKVYLNLGRGYAVPSDELSLEMFEKYIAGCKIEKCQTSL